MNSADILTAPLFTYTSVLMHRWKYDRKFVHLGDGDCFVQSRWRGVQQLAQFEVGQLLRQHPQPHAAHEILRALQMHPHLNGAKIQAVVCYYCKCGIKTLFNNVLGKKQCAYAHKLQVKVAKITPLDGLTRSKQDPINPGHGAWYFDWPPQIDTEKKCLCRRCRRHGTIKCLFEKVGPTFPSSLALKALKSSLARSGSISSPHNGSAVPSTGTGLPPLTSCKPQSSGSPYHQVKSGQALCMALFSSIGAPGNSHVNCCFGHTHDKTKLESHSAPDNGQGAMAALFCPNSPRHRDICPCPLSL